MPYPYIDTPRTEADGNATYMTGYRSAGRTHLSALDSVENSFQTPSKDEDIIKTIENGRKRNSGGFKLTTPRAGLGPKPTRSALRHLPAAAPAKGEFTPLMQSATRNNMLKNMSAVRGAGGPKTPAYLKSNYRSNGNTPGLPEMTGIYEDDVMEDEATPVPHVASSSAQSTPLPMLPGRDGGFLNDGQNMMTLKEQERVIDKLEKDNFGLKLKIHYLQEQIEKAGPEYNQAALKENTELKVAKLTIQRDLSRYKKGLLQAERDLQIYRAQVQELREKNRRRQTDETIQREMDLMRQDIETRDAQVKSLQNELRDVKSKQSEVVDSLRDDIEDLEATVREKDRMIEEREEEIEELKDKDNKEHFAVSELQTELERAKEQLEDLQKSLDQAKSAAREAQDAEKRAMQEKAQAEDDLRELHEEMANKSISTKGLSRQLEEKASRLEGEVHEMQRERYDLQAELKRIKEELAETKENLDKAKSACEETKDSAKRASQEKDRVKEELRQLHEEMANRSLGRGYSRQLEEKANKLDKELRETQRENHAIKKELDAKTQHESRLEEQYERMKEQAEENLKLLQDEMANKSSGTKKINRLFEEREKKLEQELREVQEEHDALRKELDRKTQHESYLEEQYQRIQREMESERRESQDAEEARKREKALLQREADQMASSVRTYKSRIAELEKELHEALMRKFDTRSPHSSPSSKLHEELRSLRRELSDTHRSLRDLKMKNRDLEHAMMREEDQRDLHELLKTSTLEAESLALKLSERDARVHELKAQLRRIREERANYVDKAEAVGKELEALQDRYEQALEKLSTSNTENRSKHEKEVRGLGKEIVWLRARLKREQRFRRDLAWSKGLMELGERVRVACNQADLRMVAEMGIKPHESNKDLQNPRQKLKRTISTVIAAIRIQRMAREWKKTRELGENLKRAKDEVLKRRRSSKKGLQW